MTISIDTTRSDLIDTMKLRSHILYDWLDVEKEYLPMSVRSFEGTMEVYVTDEFAKLAIDFFSEWFIGVLNSSNKKRANQIAKDFRQKAEELFISNMILHE